MIPFGVSVEHFNQYDQKKVRRIRERYGPRIVLGVGRLVYYKGFEHLVRAMAQVNAHLLIIGQGPSPADSVALGNAINQLLHQSNRHAELGERARSRVKQKFTVKRMVQSTFELYQEITNGKNGEEIDA